MAKRSNKYKLTLEGLELASGEPATAPPLTLEFDNHDEIFGIVKRLQDKDPFDDKNQAAEFAIGLKLFSEVMIKNRNHELFTELAPAFKLFMERLKR